MKLTTTIIAILPTVFLASCNDDPKAATETNFKRAINDHYAHHCIVAGEDSTGLWNTSFPITIDLQTVDPKAAEFFRKETEKSNALSAGKWDALVGVGLLKVEDKTKTSTSFGETVQTPQKVYSLTDKGQSSFYRSTAFCAGHEQIDTIEHFSEPSDAPFGGGKFSEVVFKTSPHDVPDWAKNSAVQDAWPNLKHALQPNQEQHMVLIQTNKGWIEEHDFEGKN